jgi:hypothetical protein
MTEFFNLQVVKPHGEARGKTARHRTMLRIARRTTKVVARRLLTR